MSASAIAFWIWCAASGLFLGTYTEWSKWRWFCALAALCAFNTFMTSVVLP